ncbi:MAG: GDP-mannose 4,6-dehydratase [Candidatus Omnitrophica bacterium]|nr:GDP-mannose 4,6-dehydratase [Candidatus Omnitrophota bacterium]
MDKKRIYLVTGASGFVGACLVRRLISRNEIVHIIVRNNSNLWRVNDILRKINVHICDLTEFNKLARIIRKTKPNVIYHLATYGAYSSQNDTDLCIDTNVNGTRNLLNAASAVDYELFVNTGSSSEYGFKKKPMKETDLLEPASYYAVAKSAQTLLCSYFAKENSKPIATLRLFSAYGPYEGGSRFIPTLLKALYNGKKMNLVSPEISRDWIYVEDIVDAYLMIDKLKKFKGEIFNIGTGRQKNIEEVVGLSSKITGKTTVFNWQGMNNRIWDTDYWVADMSKTKKLLKWRPKVDLKEGILLTWSWLRDNLHLYV